MGIATSLKRHYVEMVSRQSPVVMVGATITKHGLVSQPRASVGKRGEQMADPGDTGERRSFCKLWGHLRHSTHLP